MPGEGDILSMLMGVSGAQGAAPAPAGGGDASALGNIMAQQASPFLQGQPSQSGPMGQIAQALMPLVMGPIYAKQVAASQQQQHAATLLQAVKLANELTEADLKRLELQEKLHPDYKPVIDFVRAIKESGGDLGGVEATIKGPAGSSVKIGGAAAGGPKTMEAAWLAANPNATPEELIAANKRFKEGGIADAITGLTGGMKAEQDAKRGYSVTPGAVPGTSTVKLLPGSTQATAAFKQLNSIDKLESTLDTFAAVIKADPSSIGGVATMKNLLAGVGYQYDQLRADAQRFAMEATKSAATPEDRVALRSSETFKNLFNPNATKAQVLRSMLTFQVAAGLFGQTNQGMSDKDRAAAEKQLGPDFFATPEGMLTAAAVMKATLKVNREIEMRSLEYTVDEAGRVLPGSPTPVLGGPPNALKAGGFTHDITGREAEVDALMKSMPKGSTEADVDAKIRALLGE